MSTEHAAPFFSMSENQFDKEIRVSIAKILTMHGMKDVPSAAELGLLKKMILSTFKYSRMNIMQFDQAFEFNLADELDEKLNPYNMFSIEFMCGVLNMYLKRQRQSLNERPIAAIEQSSTPTKEEIEKNIIALKHTILNYFTRFCADANCVFNNPAFVYVFLEKNNIVNESTESKIEILEQARLIRLKELQSTDTTDPRNSIKSIRESIVSLKLGQMPENEIGMIRIIAREIALRKLFTEWKEQKIDVSKKLLLS